MHSVFMSTGVDSTAPLAQENMPYDNSWVNMNPYPSTMAGYASTEFGYMPPITTQGLPPHELSHDGLHRMPPPLQPRQSPLQKHASDLPLKQQQQHQQQQPPPLSMPPLSMAHQAPPHHHQLPQLPMLTVPSHPTWPSMLTNPSYAAAQTQSIHIAPRSGPLPPQPPPLRTKMGDRDGKPNPRKMLTDDDRRRMCEYAEMNPGIKQSEIGAHFGVERSTVSKVLRNKDKYKNDRSKSPGAKKSKGAKFPDIERALSNWVRNAQKMGMPVTDTHIKEKLHFFATNTGNGETILKSSTASWLEKFKQKNGIGSGRLVRRASETNIPKRKSSMHSMNQVPSPMLGAMDTTGGNDSPLSPVTRHLSGSPTSANRSDEERETSNGGPTVVGHQFMGFGPDGNSNGNGSSHNHGGHVNPSSLSNNMTMGTRIGGMGGYKHGNNQSTTSLASVFTETPVSSFSGSALSPTAPYTFSPDANVGAFLTTDPMAPPGSSNFQRPRSQTLPALNLDYDNQQQHQHHLGHLGHLGHSDATGEAVTPKYLHSSHNHHHQQLSSTAPSSAIDSPMTDVSGPSYGLDSAVVSPQLRRSGSNSSLFQSNPRSAGGLGGSSGILSSPLVGNNNNNINGNNSNGSANGSINNGGANGNGPSGSACGSAPNSPTQDDARRAADTLLTFIRTGQNGFDQTDLKAVTRMIDKLRLQQTTTKNHGGMGGLSQIPEGEGEMGSEPTTHHIKVETTLAA